MIGNQTADGASQADALASGLAAAAWMMAVFSFLGVLMAFVMARHRAATGTLNDAAARGGAHAHVADLGDRQRATQRTAPGPHASSP